MAVMGFGFGFSLIDRQISGGGPYKHGIGF